MHYFDLQFISILIVQYWLAYNTRCHNTKTIQINFVHIKLSFYTLIKYNINIFVFIFIIVFTKNKINVNFVKLVFIIFLRFFVIGFNRLFFFSRTFCDCIGRICVHSKHFLGMLSTHLHAIREYVARPTNGFLYL